MTHRLTEKNIKKIKVGDVVKFFDSTNPKKFKVGVVYDIDDKLGIRCHEEGGTYFGFYRAAFTGKTKFNILKNHPPVARYGNGYDFISNHT